LRSDRLRLLRVLRHWLAKGWPILLAGALLAALVFPYLTSAYYLEMAGRVLDSPRDAALSTPGRDQVAVAVARLGAALHWQEENAPAWRALGQAQILQGNLVEAAQALSRYTELWPNNPIGWWELAGVYGAMAAELDKAGQDALLASLVREQGPATEPADRPAVLATWKMPLAPGLSLDAGCPLPGPVAQSVLAMYPGSRVEFEFSVPITATSFFFWMGLDPESWWTQQDGLTYSVVVNGNESQSRHLAVAETRQGWWPGTVDLAHWAGERIVLALEVAGGGANSGRGGWGGVRLLPPESIAYASLAPQQARVAAWRAGGFTARTLVAAGDQARQEGQFDVAWAWYEQAIALEPESRFAWYSAAAFCGDMIVADPARLGEMAHACQEYVGWNGGNWIVNGGFEEDQLGWTRYRPSAEKAAFDIVAPPSPEGEFSARIWGRSDDYHGGWWQRLALEEGQWYRYSVTLRVQESQMLEARVLYWESYHEGAPIGRYAQVVSQDFDWTYFEVDFQAPATEQGIVLYPVLVNGQGMVWIDDVRLVELAEAPAGGSD
jgi:tetratricopeptide (TPR) repeat protein